MSKTFSRVLALTLSLSLIFSGIISGSVFAEGETSGTTSTETIVDGNLALCDYINTIYEAAHVTVGAYPFREDCSVITSDMFVPLSRELLIPAGTSLVLKNVKLEMYGSDSSRFNIAGSLTIEASEIKNSAGCVLLLDESMSSSNLIIKSGTFTSTLSGENSSPICLRKTDGSTESSAFDKLKEFIPETSIYVDLGSVEETELTSVSEKTIHVGKYEEREDYVDFYGFSTTTVKVVEKGKGEELEPETPTETETPSEPEIENPDTSVGENLPLYYVLFTTFSLVIFTTILRGNFFKNRGKNR